ncbi:hypothetical protein HDU93_000249 [Gonapodya sp. JEL0774]|nr:hypothetical protein HDU93_000249 [Gonapodya sp. JEL0774]
MASAYPARLLIVLLLASLVPFANVLAQNATESTTTSVPTSLPTALLTPIYTPVILNYTPTGDTKSRVQVSAKDYPNIALISIKGDSTVTCTGILVQAKPIPVMLTAAHCANDNTRLKSAISVVMGIDDEAQFKQCDTTWFRTLKIINHDMYGIPKCDPKGKVDTMGYDVSLWVLAPKDRTRPITLDANVLKINSKESFPPENEPFNDLAIGWGLINVGNAEITKSATTSYLHKSELRSESIGVCEKKYHLCDGTRSRFACVGGSSSTCNGDSGGPHYYKKTIWAITSFGSATCGDSQPGVVLRTSGFYNWMEITLKKVNSNASYLAAQKP